MSCVLFTVLENLRKQPMDEIVVDIRLTANVSLDLLSCPELLFEVNYSKNSHLVLIYDEQVAIEHFGSVLLRA